MGENGPKLLDLIPNEREWSTNGGCKKPSDENRKLELRLGLPGDESEGWSNQNMSMNMSNKGGLSGRGGGEREESSQQQHPLYVGYYQKQGNLGGGSNQHQAAGPSHAYFHHQQQQHHHHQYQTSSPKVLPVVKKESSSSQLQNAERKAFSPSSANTAVPNTSQKRAAPAPVVGWPPIRSFRKNLASSSLSKPVSEPQNEIPSKPVNEKPANENPRKGQFVKINMDGVPIGRKVDLSAYDSYGTLSSAVDKLFRGLLAAQRDSSTGGIDDKQEQKPITGLLDGSGEYTLVYEDNEGDRMLVGDVPWHMFVSTVKRLRVLKSSDLPTLNRGTGKQGKVLVECASTR